VNQPPGRRQVLGGLAAAALTTSLTACSTPGPARPAAPRKRYGGNLVAGLTGGSSSDTLDPHQGLSYPDTARAQALYEPLVQLSADASRIEYVLATEMTPRDAKGTQWVIRLRKGITYHDGRPLTASDVIYTFRRIITSQYSAAHVLGPVEPAGIKALDPLTVLVPMSRPYTTLPEQLAGILTAQIVPAGYTPRSRPNGTGPFRYRSFTPGRQSVFTRNPHYWQPGLPYVGTLTLIDFPNTISLADALRTGQVHAAGTLDPQQVPDLSTAGGIKVVISQAGTIIPFTMRTDQAPFRDVRVRQAMRLLADRPQLIASALDGQGTTASDVFSPYDPDFDRSLTRHADIPQAKSLLKQAGREDLKVTLVTSPIATGTVAMATVLAEQARAADVTITLKTVPPGTFFGPGYLNWTFAQDFYSYAPYLAQATLSMLPASPWNETHNRNPQYVSWYQQANATTDAGLRRELVRQMQHYDFTQGGYIIPAFVNTIDAYSGTITGYGPSRIGQPLMDYGFARLAFTR
jgi:peptide/nickel transport system substrate-binding protein